MIERFCFRPRACCDFPFFIFSITLLSDIELQSRMGKEHYFPLRSLDTFMSIARQPNLATLLIRNENIVNGFSCSPLVLDNNCSWCHQDVSPLSTEIIGSQGTVFCSENCFLFWRRASFKRAKTCDFCKSVRNAVSYVDFNDGATQLQFCSDKCLNQYKMHIFCRETQAHLELNPHLKEKKDVGGKMRFPKRCCSFNLCARYENELLDFIRFFPLLKIGK